jgi:hypothetical protein
MRFVGIPRFFMFSRATSNGHIVLAARAEAS